MMGLETPSEDKVPASSAWGGPVAVWRHVTTVLWALQILWAGYGCASSGPYRYGKFHGDGYQPEPIVVERGKPHKTLDRLAWCVGIPSKIFTLNAKTNNHNVSDETIEELKDYLEENDLGDVYVSVNDYNPKLQWKRLRENQLVSPYWKYTVGTMMWLGYTIVPNRVVGGDEYNPFTNTLIVSSDVPVILLGEAAFAKDLRLRRFPGAYAVVNDLPVVSLWRHTVATNDVLSYARDRVDWDTEKKAYETLYPHIGSTTFGPASHFVPIAGSFMSAAGAAVGQVAGRTVEKIQEPGAVHLPAEDEAVLVSGEQQGNSPELDSTARKRGSRAIPLKQVEHAHHEDQPDP
jgi:hypothetical protein